MEAATAARIVITGRGVMSAIGTSVAAFEASLLNGEGGIRQHDGLMPGQTAHVGLVGPFEAEPGLDGIVAAGCDRTAQLAAAAVVQALREAGLWEGASLGLPATDLALLLGSSHGGRSQIDRFVNGGCNAEDPALAWGVMEIGAHAHQTAVVASLLGIRGPVLTVSTACSSSGTAIVHGIDLLRGGQVRAVVAGGADAFSQLTYAGFQALGAVADGPCGPFSERLGISLGEGAAFVVLERLEDALARRATPLGEIYASATTWDAHHLTAPEPSGDGMRRAIEEALAAASLAPGSVGYVNAHGTGTRANDIAETLAIKRVFPGAPPPVSATKSFTGHTLGASSAAGLLAGLAGLHNGVLPPTLNFGGKRPGCDLDYVPQRGRAATFDRFLALSAAFGGCNCAIAAGHVGGGVPQVAATDAVVITGMGVMSTLGCDPQAAYAAWLDGAAGWADGAHSAPVAGFDPKRHLPRGRLPRMNLITQLAVAAIEQALVSAGWPAARRRPAAMGLMVGLSRGASGSFQSCIESVAGAGGWNGASPAAFPHLVMSSIGGQASVAAGLKGAASTVVGEAEIGLAVLGQAASLLAQRPQLDAVIVLAADELAPLFLQLQRTAYGAAALPQADGAVALVLERQSAALARGARPLAHLAGWGQSFDAAPGPLGAERDGVWLEHAIRGALGRAGVTPGDVGFALTLARGDAGFNERDAACLLRLFGNHAPPISTLSGAAGWAEASGGLLAVAMALCSLQHGKIAPPAAASGLGAPWLSTTAHGDFTSALVVGSSRHGNNAAVVLHQPASLAA